MLAGLAGLVLATSAPLAGTTVVIDPGHQLGNHNFPTAINAPVPGNRVDADLLVSVHGDGSYAAGARGFHVIAPADRSPWTSDIHRPSLQLAGDVRTGLLASGFPVANYIAGGDGLDVRSDLATLNLSDVPAVRDLGASGRRVGNWLPTRRPNTRKPGRLVTSYLPASVELR